MEIGKLTFEAMDPKLYPCFELAIDIGSRKGTWPSALMGADEAAVELFLNRSIKFTEIPNVIQSVIDDHQPIDNPNLGEVISAADWAAERARENVGASRQAHTPRS